MVPNDGQKGMGLILLVLIGFLPTSLRARSWKHPERAQNVREAAISIRDVIAKVKTGPKVPSITTDLDAIATALEGKTSFAEVRTLRSLDDSSGNLSISQGHSAQSRTLSGRV